MEKFLESFRVVALAAETALQPIPGARHCERIFRLYRKYNLCVRSFDNFERTIIN